MKRCVCIFFSMFFAILTGTALCGNNRPLKNKAKLSRININLRLGYISVFIGDRLVVRQTITDPRYRAAVMKGRLDSFFKLPELSLDRDGNYQLPIKIVNFPHFPQIEGTCFEASAREWAIYFSGDIAADAPCLWDVGLFNTAVKKGVFNVSYSNALVKVKISRDGSVKYSGNIDSDINRATFKELHDWLKKYLGVKFESFRFKSRKNARKFNLPALVSRNLLLGNGVIVFSQSHAMNAFGTYGEYLFISSWGKDFLVKRPPKNSGSHFLEEFVLFLPNRDKSGVVITPIEDLVKPEIYNKALKGEPEKKKTVAKPSSDWILPFGGEFSEWYGDISLAASQKSPFSIALKKSKTENKVVFSGEFYIWGRGGFIFDFDKKKKSFIALLVYPDKQNFVLYENGKFTLIKSFKTELSQNTWEHFDFEVVQDKVRVKLGRKFSTLLKAPRKMENCAAGIIVDKSSRMRVRKFKD